MKPIVFLPSHGGGGRKLAGKNLLRPENDRKPWNDFQDSVVVSLYGETSVERLAAELGRTAAAVRARARTIGIRRDSTREERYSAIENWKKKRNQRTKTRK